MVTEPLTHHRGGAGGRWGGGVGGGGGVPSFPGRKLTEGRTESQTGGTGHFLQILTQPFIYYFRPKAQF
jgi:hypothetical protein